LVVSNVVVDSVRTVPVASRKAAVKPRDVSAALLVVAANRLVIRIRRPTTRLFLRFNLLTAHLRVIACLR
jgi:hypothetical protein